MTKISNYSNLYVSNSTITKAGRGVFTRAKIKKEEIIETCPVYVFPVADYPLIKQTSLRDYYFMWGKKTAALCFGFGSLYNHSYEPNATYRKNIQDKTIDFIALEDIDPEKEITINYNYGNPNNKSKLWIESIPSHQA